MRLAMGALVIELGAIALVAVRRAGLTGWQQLGTVAVLIGVGAIVIGAKTIVHRPSKRVTQKCDLLPCGEAPSKRTLGIITVGHDHKFDH